MEDVDRFIRIMQKMSEAEKAGLLLMLTGLNAMTDKEKSGRKTANRYLEEVR